ncbi:MAG: hypothetical protein AUH09_08675 [Candidatus Rokubacteria bacterium 13_2_20CM_70_12]|nr:MAG: hypothetical protein AUH09_08675 [Candidatus Rokubacteria bacterium 13_2_20CM_70_12]
MGSWGREDDRGVELSDEVLCRRTAERDEAAFDALVARYQGRAYRLAWSIVRNAEDARDVSQEAFIEVLDLVLPHRRQPVSRSAAQASGLEALGA